MRADDGLTTAEKNLNLIFDYIFPGEVKGLVQWIQPDEYIEPKHGDGKGDVNDVRSKRESLKNL